MAVLDWTVALSPSAFGSETHTPETSLTVAAPACNPGDTLVLAAIGTWNTAITPVTPSGWTRQSGSGATLGVYTKTAGSGDVGASFTVSFSAACAGTVICASLPPGTTGSTSFVTSTDGVRSWTPAIPGSPGADDEILLLAGIITPLTFFGGEANLEFPPAWTWEIPPLGTSLTFGMSGSPSIPGSALGLASFRGPAGNPVLTSTTDSQFYAGFLVFTTTATAPPWLRVTASVSAAPDPGTVVATQPDPRMVLTVKALAGAGTPAAIAAAAHAAASGASGEVTLTPARSGSVIYGAATQGGAAAAFTPAPGTTFSQDIVDVDAAMGDRAVGTFQSSAPVTAGIAVTVGASGPAGTSQVAAAEILATSALAEVAAATASAIYPWQYRGLPASQTAIFTALPPVGTLLAAMVSWAELSQALTITVSDSTGMQWTEVVSQSGTGQGYAGVWVAQYGVRTGPPGVPAGLRVTGATSSAVSLSWTAPAQGPVTGYDVYADGIKVLSPATTSATVGNLAPGTAYSFTVDAWNSLGTSGQATAVVGVTGSSGAQPPPPQSAGSGCLLGLRPVPSAGVSPEADFAGSVIARERLLGRKLDIVTTWRNWDPATENTSAEAACIQGGRIPMLTWPLPADVPSGASAGIAAGTYDAVIYGWGLKIAALGGRVLFRPMPDANADVNFGPDPAAYVTSWQRIQTIIKGSAAQFAALSPACTAGPAITAGNVEMVWAMAHRGTTAAGGNLWASYYPGNDYADWIALDAYNTDPPSQLISDLLTSGDYADPSSSHNWYATYAGLRQSSGSLIPLMISETGCTEADDPGVAGQPWAKAYWLAQAQALIEGFPAVRAVVYTDAAMPAGDFRLDTAPGAVVISDSASNPTLAAAITWAGDPYYDRRMRIQAAAGQLYFLQDPPGS